jgi:hypothetical protein
MPTARSNYRSSVRRPTTANRRFVTDTFQSSGAGLMNRLKFLLASLVACMAIAACTKKDFNAITGTTDYTSVAVTSSPESYDLHVQFVPQAIVVDTATGLPDTIPAHYEPVDSTAFSVTATLEPQGVAVANATTNMTIGTDNSEVATLNGDGGYVIGTSPGTTHLIFVYTDVDHNLAQDSLSVPVTVTAAP